MVANENFKFTLNSKFHLNNFIEHFPPKIEFQLISTIDMNGEILIKLNEEKKHSKNSIELHSTHV